MLPYWSLSVTVTLKACPAFALPGASSTRLAAFAARTVRVTVPVIVAVTLSVPVIVCEPALMSVAEKAPWPFVSVESAGRTTPAELSLLVKCTVLA